MNPIRDIGTVHPGAVLYHSAFGFARVQQVQTNTVQLDWDGAGGNLPGEVDHDVVLRVYALCPEGGFFFRASHAPEALQSLLQENPGEGLALLLADLTGPQQEQDLREWIVGRGLMTEAAFPHWWEALRPSLVEDLRFRADGDEIALRDDEAGEGPMARLDNPVLPAGKRLDLALAHRDALDESVYLEQIYTVLKTGNTPVRELALTALRHQSPDDVLSGLIQMGPESIEGIIHAIRRAGWEPDQVSPPVHDALFELVLEGVGGSADLDQEGRLLAALCRWPSEGIRTALADQAALPEGRRLLRVAFAALPPRRAEVLGLDLLTVCLSSPDPKTAQWLGGEILAIALVDPETLADRLDSDDTPDLAAWFRDSYRPVEAKPAVPEYDDLTEDIPQTAEIELSDVVEQPITLSRLPQRSGASLLGLGLAIARGLSAHHKEGRVANPTAHSVLVRPDETMEIVCVPRDDGSCPRPLVEEPSPASDVYAASVLLLEAILGRRWPRNLPASRALPYLRTAIPLLPPSTLAPLDAGLHPDPSQRPRDGLEWLARWQTAAVTEESRAYAARDPNARLRIGYDSHVGRMKVLLTQTNQDCLFLATKGALSLLVVCDGISTANAGSGDIASSIACHVIANLWEQALPRLTNAGPSDLKDFLDQALRMANTAVCEAALRFAGGNLDGRVPMGTTCTVAVIHGNWVSLAWLGDSRAYLLGPYGASLLTADENQAGERLKAWHLNFLDTWDPAGFALVGYLGHFDDMMRPEALSAHHTAFTLLPGEGLAICSDGVTDYIGETHPEVAALMTEIGSLDDPDEASRQLVALANRGGGGDNATCLIARLWD